MSGMVLIVPGATDEELQAGLEAAKLFLEIHGVTPMDVAAAEYAHECWDDGGFEEDEEPSADAQRVSRIWGQAQTVAVDTTCASWRRLPPHGCQLYPFDDAAG